MTAPLDQSTARQIVEGRHGDPFSVLGQHTLPDGTQSVRVFRPNVDLVEVLASGSDLVLGTLAPVDGAPDLYEGILPGVVGRYDYRLRLSNSDATWEEEDAYAYGPILGEMDEYLLGEGTHGQLWRALGAHLTALGSAPGVHFAVWAPNASRVSVVGSFNDWDGRRHAMRRRGDTGIWEIFVPGVTEGAVYKYELLDANGQLLPLKADPVGFGSEVPPLTASVVRDLSQYWWQDHGWMATRWQKHRIDQPISIYEVHLESWRRVPEDSNRSLSYREMADQLVRYAADMGFTHIELTPVSEHPFGGSWGYQPVGLYAPTSRFGSPDDFRALVEATHEAGLGLIIDWVPGHFPTDAHGLAQFDGTALYEHSDPKEGYHPDWNTLVYNYGRSEVSNFLIANARYWLEEFHIDGLRVDAVASMLYRDYSRIEGEWVPNE
ncbi:unnamed protein product, partial [Chrysoparadoxa australica]